MVSVAHSLPSQRLGAAERQSMVKLAIFCSSLRSNAAFQALARLSPRPRQPGAAQ